MPRHRHRLFTVCAAVIIFMLYRVVQNSWDDSQRYGKPRFPQKPEPAPLANDRDQTHAADGLPRKEEPPQVLPAENKVEETVGNTNSKPHRIADQEQAREDDVVDFKFPLLKNAGGKDEDEVEIHMKNPPKSAVVKPTDAAKQIHWAPVSEHFPLPTESVISLPTGRPQKIPRIQHEFGIEAPDAQTKRIRRQERVKKEIERAWTGYRKYAWMHDELSPVSAKYRDPFCGWAATLVDSLDTLWIAGLKDEFDEAAKAVKNIDFTYTPRNSIPVFETTIRYLGGLLGAFDVSGGHDGAYPMLLDKAVELAGILMGVFDTPNRMPILYYQWEPQYASQPHRAGIVGIAELGTLSMEFTRLAQLTGKSKYYDAVDRITNALIEMQNAGTSIPGLFPDNIDASGCNRTASSIRASVSKQAQSQFDSDELSEKPAGYVSSPNAKDGAGGRKGASRSRSDSVLERRRAIPAKGEGVKGVVAEDVGGGMKKSIQVPTQDMPKRRPPFAADGSTAKWDCEPQRLVPASFGSQSFHMGGGQDSAYEYFPKQYLLLGGLESKYKKLHEDAINAIDEWLLYRPMTEGDWDILFPAKVSTHGDPRNDLTVSFEMTHLTCFIGGMYGLGGKVFGREKDLETAKRLTDGCVWAYQVSPSGIMAESSRLMSCPTLEKCEFNQTLWYQKLDPSASWRQRKLAEWEEEVQQLQIKQAETRQRIGDSSNMEASVDSSSVDGHEEKSKQMAADMLRQTAQDYSGSSAEKKASSSSEASGGSKHIRKRAAVPAEGHRTHYASELKKDKGSELPQSLKDKLGLKDDEKPSSQTTMSQRPLSHEEFVQDKIERWRLPPGFVSIPSKHYILRPEAVESVWYMYRITGDPTWMEKGWAMFEATIRATRTEIANSAVDDVTSDEPALKDEMESFWLAETLKYYYLLFSEPDVISLDEWVLNTEAHPFKRPR